MSIRILLIVFLSFLSFFSEAVNMDLSGWFRTESYNHPQNDYYYVTSQLVLKPEIQISKDFQVNFQLDFTPKTHAFDYFNDHRLYPIEYRRQTGAVLFYTDQLMDQRKKINLPFLYLNLSQFYLKYEHEWATIRLGMAPYHFGMGITHSAPEDYSTQNFISAFNQLDVLIKLSEFYIRPILAVSSYREYAQVEAGFSKDDWALASLYKVSDAHITIGDEDREIRTIETFGRYKKDNWELKISNSFVDGYSYDKDEENNFNILQAIEARIEIPGETPLELKIKAGRALGKAAFHPNYNVALIHWNREFGLNSKQRTIKHTKVEKFFLGDAKSMIPYFIENGQIYKSSYLSTSFNFSFEQNKFTLKPLFLLARNDANTESPDISYELNLEGRYKWNENLSFILQGGIAYNYQALSTKQEFNQTKQAEVSDAKIKTETEIETEIKTEAKFSWKWRNWFRERKQKQIAQQEQKKIMNANANVNVNTNVNANLNTDWNATVNANWPHNAALLAQIIYKF